MCLTFCLVLIGLMIRLFKPRTSKITFFTKNHNSAPPVYGNPVFCLVVNTINICHKQRWIKQLWRYQGVCGQFGCGRFLAVLFPIIEPIPTHEKKNAVGKRDPNVTFNLIFLGLGWLWVGESIGFITIIYMFFRP